MKYATRIGTGLVLAALVFSCATVPGLKDEATGSVIRIPFVRVLLHENSGKVNIEADAPFAIECLVDNKQTVYYSSRPVTVLNRNGNLLVRGRNGSNIEDDLQEINIIPRGKGNRIKIDKKRYRGIIKIIPIGQNVQVVNVVYMEDYLRGVVPPEIGKRSDKEIESVKAQAVAARTYALGHLQQYSGAAYDLRSSIMDQVYLGVDVENSVVNRAIDATAGSVVMFEDKFIDAYYHSTCGGSTDDINQVWDRPEVPFLKAVSDSGACSWSKYYTWEETFTEKQLRGRIEQYLASDRGRDLRIGRIEDLIVREQTPGGRVSKLTVRTTNDLFHFKKDRIRWVIGRTSNADLILPSDRFEVKIERDAQGFISRVNFVGRGYGHGVGMCQCGAIGLSREGWTYEDILRHYYTNTEIRKLY